MSATDQKKMEVDQSLAMAVRGESAQTKSKSKWRRRKFPRRNDTVRNQGLLMQDGAYEPPRLTELRRQNRLKTRRFYPRNSQPPRAPRNTTSFIMRAKKSGCSASLVSPVTPAILPTPALSPDPHYREGLVEQVNEEWGVNGYGSMSGLIRLRSLDLGGDGTVSESDAEQDSHAQSVQQLEQRIDQRIDHGLSRFEVVYPSASTAVGNRQLMEVRLEELERHIAELEDENLSLKENLYLLRQELAESKRTSRLQDGGDCGSDEAAEVVNSGP